MTCKRREKREDWRARQQTSSTEGKSGSNEGRTLNHEQPPTNILVLRICGNAGEDSGLGKRRTGVGAGEDSG